MTKPLLELRDIVKTFGSVKALDRASLTLRAGEVHALMGENGAGKSTLIKVLTGVHAPDAGTIVFDGKPIAPRAPRGDRGRAHDPGGAADPAGPLAGRGRAHVPEPRLAAR